MQRAGSVRRASRPTKRDRNRTRRKAGDLSRAGMAFLSDELAAGFDLGDTLFELIFLSILPAFFLFFTVFSVWEDWPYVREILEFVLPMLLFVTLFSVPLVLLLVHLVRLRRLRRDYLRFDKKGVHSKYRGLFVPWNEVQELKVKNTFSDNPFLYQKVEVTVAARDGAKGANKKGNRVRHKWRLTASGIDPFLLDYMAEVWPLVAAEEARKENWRNRGASGPTQAPS